MYSSFTPSEYKMNSSSIASTSETYPFDNSSVNFSALHSEKFISGFGNASAETVNFPSQATENWYSPTLRSGESLNKTIDASLLSNLPSQSTENISSGEPFNFSTLQSEKFISGFANTSPGYDIFPSQDVGNWSSLLANTSESPNYIKIPKSSLGYKTNNVYPEYPPLMSDGRAIVASDQSETIVNYSFLKTSGVKTNWDYRNYLMNNSEKIRELNTLEAFNDVGYYKRFVNPPDSNQPNAVPPPDNSQTESDLKQLYKTREELNSRIYAPSISIS